MNTILWIVRKDLWRFLADRNGALMTVLTPVFLGMLLGVLFSQSGGSSPLEMVIVNQSSGPRITAFVSALEADPAFKVRSAPLAEARAELKSGDTAIALVLPKGTDAALTLENLFGTGDKAKITLLADPSRSIESEMAAGLITRHLMETVSKSFGDPTELGKMFGTLKGGSYRLGPAWNAFFDQGEKLAAAVLSTGAETGETGESGGMQLPVELELQSVLAGGQNREYNPYAHNFAGMLCMFLMFWGQRSATQLFDERGEGALTRVRLTGASSTALLVGTGVSTAIVALVISAIIYLVAIGLFGVEVRGSWLGLGGVLLAESVFIGGFTLFLVGMARSRAQIENLGVFAILVMSFVGGATIPAFIFPEWIQQISAFVPAHWTTEGLAAMTWRGLPLSAALAPIALLTGLGVVLGAVGIRRFRWRS